MEVSFYSSEVRKGLGLGAHVNYHATCTNRSKNWTKPAFDYLIRGEDVNGEYVYIIPDAAASVTKVLLLMLLHPTAHTERLISPPMHQTAGSLHQMGEMMQNLFF